MKSGVSKVKVKIRLLGGLKVKDKFGKDVRELEVLVQKGSKILEIVNSIGLKEEALLVVLNKKVVKVDETSVDEDSNLIITPLIEGGKQQNF
jgi:sulfur carrier protein ThiS